MAHDTQLPMWYQNSTKVIPKWYHNSTKLVPNHILPNRCGVYEVYMLPRQELSDFLQVLFAQVMSKLCQVFWVSIWSRDVLSECFDQCSHRFSFASMVLFRTGVIWKGERMLDVGHCWIRRRSGWLWELLAERTSPSYPIHYLGDKKSAHQAPKPISPRTSHAD